MTVLRSALFTVLALIWSAALSILYLPLLLLPRRWAQRGAALWCRGLIALVGVCCGLHYRVIGGENLPAGAAILAAKHQSAWETLIFHVLLDDPVYVLKRELLSIPFLGWYLRKSGNIAIDRSAGLRAIRTMLPEAKQRLAEGAQVIVFPEGTRTPPGTRRPYHPGIAGLYAAAGLPVIPIALNSGLFWGRKRFLKFPGEITLAVLPALPPGLPRARFMAELEHGIERASAALAGDSVPDADSATAAAGGEQSCSEPVDKVIPSR